MCVLHIPYACGARYVDVQDPATGVPGQRQSGRLSRPRKAVGCCSLKKQRADGNFPGAVEHALLHIRTKEYGRCIATFEVYNEASEASNEAFEVYNVIYEVSSEAL